MPEEKPKPIRLLIADDEKDLVVFLAHRLRKRDIDVTMAVSGAEAVSAATELTFDVAIVDLRMPDMDGIQVIEQLKSLQPTIEVLMLTGHGGHDTAWEAGRLQAYRYILKPHDFDDLHKLVVEATAHRRTKLKNEFEMRLTQLMMGSASPRDIISQSDKLREHYEQD
ncbi:MAG: DNA-binding NtrC family response regulator [Candidatus Krumholzibacteriia bacterium]|jgi:DNA-binding NtrC family response regulator